MAAYVRAYGVDLDEAEGALEDYPTLDALFTRRLRAGVRPLDPAPDTLVCPCDGRVRAAGPADPAALRRLGVPVPPSGADHVEIYLSPRDYHRVHAPAAGQVATWRAVPGDRWPVFDAARARVSDLYARNERAVIALDTRRGPLWVVLVGAFGVGHIARTARGEVPRGGELGAFHLGSTVVVAVPRSPDGDASRVRWAVGPGDVVRMGSRLSKPLGAG